MPKNLVERVGKGPCTAIWVVPKRTWLNWPEARTDVAILDGPQASAKRSADLIKRKDHRATIPHRVEEYDEAAQRLMRTMDDNLEFALMDLADGLEGLYPKGAGAAPVPSFLNASSFVDALDQYAEFRPRGTRPRSID